MARLPNPGGDNGNWGDILNDYLSQSHNTDGTLKDNSVTSSSLAPGSVTASEITDATITEAKLDSAAQAKLNSGGTAGVTSVNTRSGAVTLTKTDVDLANVDNTADSAKPVSTAQQTALDLKAPSASPTFTGTVSGVTKGMVGLANVDNTTDTAKPVSTAQANADTSVQTYAVQRANHTGTQTTATISDFTEALQDAMAATLVEGANVTLTYNDGAGTITIDAASGGGGLDAEAVRDTIGTALLGSGLITATVNDGADTITISTTATANSSDATLLARANHTGTQAQNTITNLTTDLADKAPLASPTFTGTVAGVTKGHVGLGNVDNTADTAKPVSTAQQTALDSKVDLAYTLNAQTGTTYTLVLSDAGKLINLGNAGATTLTIPPNSSVAIPIGSRVLFIQIGAGQVTYAPGSGVTLSSRGAALKSAGQYAEAEAIKIATDTWILAGDLTA